MQTLRADAHRALLSWPWPDPANPYVLRLTEALVARGVVVHHARRLATHALRTHRAPWLHVHWPEWMIGSPSRIAYRARGRWVMALLDACRARGVSIAWTAHNLFMHDDPHPDLGEASRRALLQRCNVVFGHFAGAEAPLRTLGFRGRFVVTPHAHFDRDYPLAFESDVAREAYRRTLGVREGERLLVSVGAIEGYKNLPAIARALSEARIEGLRWIVAGRVGDRAAYDALCREVAAVPWITVHEGFLAPREMARIVAAGDAMLLGYRALFTSGAAVLALTQGTPVMGTPEHHLATWQGERFFIPLHRVDAAALRVAIAQLTRLDAGVRGEARRHALRDTWENAAAVIDHTLFGA